MADEITTPPEPSVETKRPINWRHVGIFFSTLGFMIVLIALLYGYFALNRLNLVLAKELSRLEYKIINLDGHLNALNSSVFALQQNIAKTETLSAEQERLMQEWRAAQQGDLKQWHVAEAHYLSKLANDLLQLTFNTEMAYVLLERADHILQKADDPQLLALRQSLVSDVAKLKAIPRLDMAGIYAQLKAIDQQIEHMPLPATPLPANKPAIQPNDADQPWWQRGLNQSWQALQRVVVIRKVGAQSPPLVLPEEKLYLIQNLHAQVDHAIWGLLHRNATVYQSSLAQMMSWIPKYYVTNDTVTQSVLQNLQNLQKANVNAPKLEINNTLQLFDNYFAMRSPSQLKS